ncbi:Protocadherin Beta-16 [Manis pentadactyla]|nr:Protocadherin Beta-16 [Manis pentadactyla]
MASRTAQVTASVGAESVPGAATADAAAGTKAARVGAGRRGRPRPRPARRASPGLSSAAREVLGSRRPSAARAVAQSWRRAVRWGATPESRGGAGASSTRRRRPSPGPKRSAARRTRAEVGNGSGSRRHQDRPGRRVVRARAPERLPLGCAPGRERERERGGGEGGRTGGGDAAPAEPWTEAPEPPPPPSASPAERRDSGAEPRRALRRARSAGAAACGIRRGSTRPGSAPASCPGPPRAR